MNPAWITPSLALGVFSAAALLHSISEPVQTPCWKLWSVGRLDPTSPKGNVVLLQVESFLEGGWIPGSPDSQI